MSREEDSLPTKRFSSRVENYVKYRPAYPPQIIDFMASDLRLRCSDVVVDIGSGTGISTELFLDHGNFVYGVEPNDQMRAAAEERFYQHPRFRSVCGIAERTGLPDHLADFIVAAQAFHWFEPQKTRVEFQRILKKDGWVVLIWNDRKTVGSAFAESYEDFLKEFGTEYGQVSHKRMESPVEPFLGRHEVRLFSNAQEFDFDGLLGRVLSSSYAPNSDHSRFGEMRSALHRLFETCNTAGRVRMEYETKVFFSKWH